MRFSVVITTYNRRKSLERCLSSLVAQNFPHSEYEIIVVADGCTDDTGELLRSFDAPCSFRWFEQRNQGSPAAQNFGVTQARGQFIFFLDDDCICEPGLLRAHDEAHQKADKLLVVGILKIHPDSPRGILYDIKIEEDPHGLRLRTVDGQTDLMLCANSSIARQAMLDCPFNPAYQRIHDVVAGEQLRRKGFRSQLEPQAVAYELFTKNLKGVLRDSMQQGKHEVQLVLDEPAFKPRAGLACMSDGNAIKRGLRKRLALYPRTSDYCLRVFGLFLRLFSFIPAASRLARRILSARLVIAMLSGGIQEAGSWRRLNALFGLRVPVITYHNVGVPQPGEFSGLTTPLAEFESHLAYLARKRYKTIQPSEWLAWKHNGGTLPERPVMIVFDDAYAEAGRKAFPLLEQHGFTAACMVVTRYTGSTNHWDQILGRPSQELMSKSEVLEWSGRGFEFGGHSSSHIHFSDASVESIRQEICECKTELTKLLGREPASFAYPYGEATPSARAAARNFFQLAFTAEEGILELNTDPYSVPRFEFLPGETRFGIWCRLRFGKSLFVVFQKRRAEIKKKASQFASALSRSRD